MKLFNLQLSSVVRSISKTMCSHYNNYNKTYIFIANMAKCTHISI